MRNFMDLLRARWEKGLFVCVGLDSDYEKLPESVQNMEAMGGGFMFPHTKIETFNRSIIDLTAPVAAAFKPNFAFYFAHGKEGLEALDYTITYVQERHPEIPVLLDVKDGDIGDTNKAYVKALFTSFMKADGITIHNYLGQTAMQPFLDQKDKGIFVLCRTSNQGAEEFQHRKVLLTSDEQMEFAGVGTVDASFPQYALLYQFVAFRVAKYWNGNGNCGLVVGAIAPDEIAEVRRIAPDIPLLNPGIGKQGGDLEKTVRAAGRNFLINSSSAIIFASKGADYAEAAGRAAYKLDEQIQQILKG